MNHVFDHVLNKAAVAAKEANAVKNNIGANSDSQSKSGPEASKQSAAKLSDEPPSTKKQIKANKGKKTKGKVSGIISKGKTLRESEMEVNEAFADKIVVKEDNTFHCRFCPLFVTSVKLLAKSHAQSCDTKKKKGRLAKQIQCNECGETFTGKKNLVKHTRESHSMPSYQCSTCMKKFKYRVYYMRHLKIHDRQPSVSCPYCSQKFRFESYKLRHIDRVHRMKLSSPQSEQENDGGEVMIEVRDEEKRLGENFFWKYEATLPNLDRAKSSSFGNFYNSLGLLNQGDWNDWMQVSEMLGLPYSVDGSHSGMEIAVVKNGTGDEKVECVGSRIITVGGFKAADLSGSDSMEDGGVKMADSDEETLTLTYNQAEANETIEEVLRSIDECYLSSTDVHDGENEEVEDTDNAANSNSGSVRSRQVVCDLCGTSGFRSAWFLRRHISQMHLGSIRCDICCNIFVDKFQYLKHSKTCFYWCGKPGCGFHDKRKPRVESHEKGHARDE